MSFPAQPTRDADSFVFLRWLLLVFASLGCEMLADAAERTIDQGSAWRSERCCAVNSLYLLLRLNGESCRYEDLSDDLLSESLTTVGDILHTAEGRGYSLMATKGDLSTIQRADSAMIAHLDILFPDGSYRGHFVVVIHCDVDKVTFIDGTTAETNQIPTAEFLAEWTGVLISRRPLWRSEHWFAMIALVVFVYCVVLTFRARRKFGSA